MQISLVCHKAGGIRTNRIGQNIPTKMGNGQKNGNGILHNNKVFLIYHWKMKTYSIKAIIGQNDGKTKGRNWLEIVGPCNKSYSNVWTIIDKKIPGKGWIQFWSGISFNLFTLLLKTAQLVADRLVTPNLKLKNKLLAIRWY